MSLLNNYLCHVIGESPADFNNMQKTGKKRVVAFATAIHLPVLLWLISGVVIANYVLKFNLSTSIVIGLIIAAFIYLIERIVISSPRSKLLSAFRIMLGLIVAYLGASFVDIVVFNPEISEQIRSHKESRITENNNILQDKISMQLVSKDLNDANFKFNNANKIYLNEIDGKSGIGRSGIGKIANEKRRLMESAETQLNQLKLKNISDIEIRNAKLTNDTKKLNLSINSESSNGLLIQIKALHQFVFKDFEAFTIWLAFLILVFSIELMVVILKLKWPETIDEFMEKQREAIVRKKAEHYTKYYDPGLLNAQKLLLEI